LTQKTYTTTTILQPFVWDYPGEPVLEETFAHSPILVINLPCPCSIYVLDSLFAQPLSKSFLVYLLVWSPPFHTPYIPSPNQYLLSQHIPSLSLSSLLGTHTFYLMSHPCDHSHLCSLKCHLVFFPDRPGLTTV